MFDYQSRIEKVKERMRAAEIDALLVSESNNIFYLSGSNGGYTGARIIFIVGAEESVLTIDKRYFDEALESAMADRMIPWTEPSFIEIVNVINEMGARRVGFEAADITVKQYNRLVKDFEGIELVGVLELVEPVREIKDEHEIERITNAAKIADEAFTHILGFIKPGLTEIDLSIELDYYMRKRGAEKPSFDTIVASGVHSAVPHATPSRRKIGVGDFVKLDFGAVFDGYHSDMTRTIVVGEANIKQREIYSLVKEAQEVALDEVAPGKVCSDVDDAARSIIAKAGYGEYFVHNLGHGVGLKVHEKPVLGKMSKAELAANMVVTVEPGIYLSGFGGVRIEDLVVVTEGGHQVLTHSTKELIEL